MLVLRLGMGLVVFWGRRAAFALYGLHLGFLLVAVWIDLESTLEQG